MDEKQRHETGMAMRRQLLGDVYVERVKNRTTPFSQDFEDLLTRYAWGEVWTRPGLDHRTRRLLIIGTMIALGHWDIFKLHARAALDGGVPADEIKEVIFQQTIYCGVPAANIAMQKIQEVLTERAATSTK